MALLEINWKPSRRELRQFAVLLTLFGLGLLAWQVWRSGGFGFAAQAAAVAAAVGLVGCLRPAWLRPLYLAWMAAAFPIGWVVSHLLLAFVFYLVLTPIGIIMKLIGRDPLQRRFDQSAETYWVRRPPRPPARRYFRQF